MAFHVRTKGISLSHPGNRGRTVEQSSQSHCVSNLRVMRSCQVASSYASLSALLRTAGRRTEALTYAQVALEAKQRAFGPQHAEVAGAMLHLADLLRDLGRCISIILSPKSRCQLQC